MISIEATKILVNNMKFFLGATKLTSFGQKFGLVTLTKNLVGSPNQNFGSAEQKFNCLNPYHFLVGLTKNEGQLDRTKSLFGCFNLYKRLEVPTKFL